jgi:hypothetical protein
MKHTLPTRSTRAFNPWPLGIITSFAVFICGAAIFITWAVGQNMDLVRKDYYEQEILFQRRINEQQRTGHLRTEISVLYDPGTQKLRIRLHVYRPSDASLDSDRPLTLTSAGTQEIDAAGWRPGLWKVQISWTVNGQDFYHEESIVTPGESR